jgi:phage RecT family recombinase
MSNDNALALVRFQTALQAPSFTQELTNSNAFKMNVAREVTFALQHLEKNEYLQKATPESVKNAVLNVVLTGLSLNPVLNQAYLVPRKVKGVVVAILDPSYQGLITKIVDFEVGRKVVAQVVHANDQFDFDESTDSMLTPHRKWYMVGASESGAEVGAYAGIQTPQGDWQYKFLPIHRVNQIMTTSESYKYGIANKTDSIWTGMHREEMIKKTAVKYLWKYLPKSEQIEAIGKAIEESNFAHATTDTQETETGVSVKTSSEQAGKDIAAQAAASMKKPVSRASKRTAENIASEPVAPEPIKEPEPIVDLSDFENVLNDVFSEVPRAPEEAFEVAELFLSNTGFDVATVSAYVGKNSKSYKTSDDLFLTAPASHILLVAKAMLSSEKKAV